MLHKFILLSVLVLSSLSVFSQGQRVRGRVLSDGSPLCGVTVAEIDSNHRVLTQTRTDEAGYFILNVKGEKTSLRVTADGMKKYTKKIGNQLEWQVYMVRETEIEANKKIKARFETSKLLVGHVSGRAVPQYTWVEQLSDSLFTIVIPVRVPSLVEEYPQGRKVVVQDYNSRIVAIGHCIEQALAEEGAPKSWDPFVRTTSGNSVNTDSQITSDVRDYYCYPRFTFTRDELEYMIDHSREIACFAVDTSRGDNYWMYYTGKNFAKELQKILNKMLK